MLDARFVARAITVALLAVFVGCSGTGRMPVTAKSEMLVFRPDMGTTLTVPVGESIFVEGRVKSVEALRMSESISSTMPGSMGLPFAFSIEKTTLMPAYTDGDYTYYPAPDNKVDARHGLLGRVITGNDSVGVRVRKRDGKKQWFVDNSDYNRQEALWTRDVRESDGVRLQACRAKVYDDSTELKQIVFDGYYNGLLNFTWRVAKGGDKEEKEFHFNLEPDGRPTKVGIKGYIFEVISVDNMTLKYRWVSVPQSQP